jgi:hypothetical protein
MNATVEGTVPLKASPSFSNTHMSTDYFEAKRPPTSRHRPGGDVEGWSLKRGSRRVESKDGIA